MKTNNLEVNYPDFFIAEKNEDIMILKFSGNFFHNIIDFDKRDFLLDYFDTISLSPEINTVITHSGYGKTGAFEYLRFFLFECQRNRSGAGSFFSGIARNELHKFCNIIDQTILKIIELDKIVINICSGNVISTFMNLGLACDYRIISDDTVFYDIYQEFGMLPKGGGPFFLSRMLGSGKAYELLLLNNQITADQALKYGFVDKVVPGKQLEEEAIATARQFGKNHASSLTGIKRLVNYSKSELKAYLAFETDEIIKISEKIQFGDQ